MHKKKYYAVKKGRHPGIYQTWDATKTEVDGYSGARFKSFATKQEAHDYLGAKTKGPRTHHYDIYFYSDGGSRNHGNCKGDHVHIHDKAAWAYLIQIGLRQIADSGAEWGATNNRMEIMGFLNALEWLLDHHYQQHAILAILDSKYVLDAVTKNWLKSWRRHHWHTSTGTPVKNAALWQQVAVVLPSFSHLEFKWTKGHANNEGNNFVDHLLNQTMDQMLLKHAQPKTALHQRSKNVHSKTSPQGQHASNHLKNRSSHISTNQSVTNLKKNFKQLGLF